MRLPARRNIGSSFRSWWGVAGLPLMAADPGGVEGKLPVLRWRVADASLAQDGGRVGPAEAAVEGFGEEVGGKVAEGDS